MGLSMSGHCLCSPIEFKSTVVVAATVVERDMAMVRLIAMAMVVVTVMVVLITAMAKDNRGNNDRDIRISNINS